MTNVGQGVETAKRVPQNPLLDTLELTAERKHTHTPPKPLGLTRKTLYKTVRKKSFQNHYLPHLVAFSQQEKNTYWEKRLWGVYHCAENLYIEQGQYKNHRCKKRECLICQGYTTRERIAKYLPVLRSFNDLQFVTLTVPNIGAHQLRQTIKQMTGVFRATLDVLRKQGFGVRGTRNLEVTFSPKRANFHPHFHCIIEGKENAKKVVKHWKRLWGTRAVTLSNKAQDIRPFGTKESDLLEAFKYANKIVSSDENRERVIYAWGLFESMKATSGGEGGIRTFQTFGFNLSDYPAEETGGEPAGEFVADPTLPDGSFTFIFDRQAGFFDYIEPSTGETLTDYRMPEAVRKFLNERIL